VTALQKLYPKFYFKQKVTTRIRPLADELTRRYAFCRRDQQDPRTTARVRRSGSKRDLESSLWLSLRPRRLQRDRLLRHFPKRPDASTGSKNFFATSPDRSRPYSLDELLLHAHQFARLDHVTGMQSSALVGDRALIAWRIHQVAGRKTL